VGGDWYDVIELGAGRTALVIGDVMGRGVQAAAVMGQLRSAIRAYTRLDLPPDELLGHLDGLVRELGGDQIVSCVYAVFDPAEQVLRMANAGHLPPVVIAADRTATVLAEATDPPLGVSSRPLDLVVVPLPSGSTLVLYTDGLVERRGEDLDDGIDDLRDVCGSLDVNLEEVPERLVQRRLPDGPDDDVAVLVARVANTRVHAVRELELVAPDVAAGQARDLVRAHLGELGIDERRVVDDAVLVASELVANALQHAELPAELRLISSRSELRVEVHDRSAAQPQRRRPEPHDDRGRGLTIVAALSEAWGARPTGTGKVVWSVVRLT
jgi:anti-sigma regulatory factor (Ser/Thr protein kinase)